MSQEDLANLLDAKFSTISAYEREKSFPDFDKLLKLSKIFVVSLDELVFRDIEKEGRGAPPTPVSAAEQDKQRDRFTRLLERRVDELEQAIKKNDPDLAKELGIE